ncbi:MAG: MFS transporter [Bacteroidales bacterium]|nr:MFS transporter [Bacteroidales bacterium]
MAVASKISIKPKLWTGDYLKVWVGNFLMYFAFYLVTPLLPLYLRDVFDADKATIGVVLSGYTITALFIRFFSGYIVDRFPRKKVLLLCYGSFMAFFFGYYFTGSLLFFAVIRTLHGAPFGITTVSSNTVAIDVLHPDRRAEGIGYYGLSNNIAMAIGPSIGLVIYHSTANYPLIFTLSIIIATIGLVIDSTIKCRDRQPVYEKKRLSLDRFILIKGWSQGITITGVAFAYGILVTYIAIYSQDVLGITSGTGGFFMLLAGGLITARLTGNKALRQGHIVRNASYGLIVAIIGYTIFISVPTIWGYYLSAFVIGLGNGNVYPAMQTMFINLAPHNQRGTATSTILSSWDIGMGLGIILGGTISEHLGGYMSAFVAALIIYTLGAIFYFLYAKKSFLKNRLR